MRYLLILCSVLAYFCTSTRRHSREYLIKQKRVEMSKHDGNIIMFKTWHIDIKLQCWYKRFFRVQNLSICRMYCRHDGPVSVSIPCYDSRSAGRKIFLGVSRRWRGLL